MHFTLTGHISTGSQILRKGPIPWQMAGSEVTGGQGSGACQLSLGRAGLMEPVWQAFCYLLLI